MYANEGTTTPKKAPTALKKTPVKTAPGPPTSVKEEVQRINDLLEERDAEAWKANIRAGTTGEPFEKWRSRMQRQYVKEAPVTPFGEWSTRSAVERLGATTEAAPAETGQRGALYSTEGVQPVSGYGAGGYGGGAGVPRRYAPLAYNNPFEQFMEESVYPPFDEFGRQVPFWSPLMSIGETGQGQDYWTWLQYWNELMRQPRALRDRILQGA